MLVEKNVRVLLVGGQEEKAALQVPATLLSKVSITFDCRRAVNQVFAVCLFPFFLPPTSLRASRDFPKKMSISPSFCRASL